MTDYHAPEIPQDPVLREMHAAVSELIGVITRRMLGANRTEAARIVGLLQEAAGAKLEVPSIEIGEGEIAVITGIPSVVITMPDGSKAYRVGGCPETVHDPQGDPPCHVDPVPEWVVRSACGPDGNDPFITRALGETDAELRDRIKAKTESGGRDDG